MRDSTKIMAPLLVLSGVVHAAGSVRQESPQALSGGTPALAATSSAFASAAQAGSTIEAYVTNDTSGTTVLPTSVVDSAGQTYTLRCHINDSTDALQLYLYTFTNNASATALTVTATWPSGVAFQGVWTKELAGVGAFQNCNNVVQTAPGTATNAITTGSITGTTTPLLVSAMTIQSGTASNTIVAGTSYVVGTTGFAFGGVNLATSESLHMTTGTPNATYTDATHGASYNYVTIGAAYADSGSGPTGTQMFFLFP